MFGALRSETEQFTPQSRTQRVHVLFNPLVRLSCFLPYLTIMDVHDEPANVTKKNGEDEPALEIESD